MVLGDCQDHNHCLDSSDWLSLPVVNGETYTIDITDDMSLNDVAEAINGHSEVNGAGDNPLVLPGEDEILSTGNFHTPALALGLETASQGFAHLAAASASRCARLLTNRFTDLPASLVEHLGMRRAPFTKVRERLAACIRRDRLLISFGSASKSKSISKSAARFAKSTCDSS